MSQSLPEVTSWRTTAIAVAKFVMALGAAALALFDGDVSTMPDIAALIAAGSLLLDALGFGFARDARVSSRSSGVT